MTDANLTQLTYDKEAVFGVTDVTPDMKKVRFTGSSLNETIDNVTSSELRTDLETADLVQTGLRENGGFDMELSFGAFDDFMEGAVFNTFQEIANISNDGVADSNITNVDDVTDTFTVLANGTDFVANSLLRTSGFAAAANNDLFKVASSTATTVVVAGTPVLVDDTAPAGDARLKSVGFEGDSGDITATATGLSSTTLDLTTLGLIVGQWIKVGGTALADKFDTLANNDYIRITAITATTIDADNLPVGWAIDAGAGKTIKVWVSDTLKNGTNFESFTLEQGFLGQAIPTYLQYRGMVVNAMTLDLSVGAIMTGNFDWLGASQQVSTITLDAAPDEAPNNPVYNSVNNVGRISEDGTVFPTDSCAQNVTINYNNNLREIVCIGTLGLVDLGKSRKDITGTMNVYFGSKEIYEKYISGAESSFNMRVQKEGQGYVVTMPRIKYETGTIDNIASDSDITTSLGYKALLDPITGTSFQIDRFEETQI